MPETDSELIERIKTLLRLEVLPGEGGFFRQTYRAAESLPSGALPPRYTEEKPFGTAILYLITPAPDGFSALHTLPTDETLHFYLGDPVDLLLLQPDGASQRVTLGQDIFAGQQVQFTVPAGCWQGSRLAPGGRYALIGSTMAPGWTDSDFILGQRAELQRAYPQEAQAIRGLTRE